MAKILRHSSKVAHINYPRPFSNEAYEAEVARYINDVRTSVGIKDYKDELIGSIVEFPVADGSASYMILSTKPLKLIHMEIGDGYEFPYIDRLILSDVMERVNHAKKIKDYLANRK